MAVYTLLSPSDIADFLAAGPAGSLIQESPILSGVENTNYDITTTKGHFILTLYEKRVSPVDLPFFLGLMRHLAAKGLPVPEPIQQGAIHGKAAALARFLPGQSFDEPPETPDVAASLGIMLARLHLAARDFTLTRADDLCSPVGWRRVAHEVDTRADGVAPGLARLIADELGVVERDWPPDDSPLPSGILHADLFPDNVLWEMGAREPRLSGIIDFYFAARGFLAYDIAITLNAWAFDSADIWQAAWAQAFLAGYETLRPLGGEERAMIPLFLRASALRFMLTRLQAWLSPAAGALVTAKDPLVFARRLCHHAGYEQI